MPRIGRRTLPEGHPAGLDVAAADARDLALELAGLRVRPALDIMRLGMVLESGELAHRVTQAWLRWRVDGAWSQALWCLVVVTDRRLVVRLPDQGLRSLWWGSLVGFEADLQRGDVVLDYGDGRPRLLSGAAVSVIAVAGVAHLYGLESLASHPALESLRDRAPRA